jgi:hypothetical protein
MYTTTSAFELMFTQIGFDNPRPAAIFYTYLIKEFPAAFDRIKSKAKLVYTNNITPGSLHKGRDELFKRGYIAQVVSSDPIKAMIECKKGEKQKKELLKSKAQSEGDTESKNRRIESSREQFIPVNPSLVYNYYKKNIKEAEELRARKIIERTEHADTMGRKSPLMFDEEEIPHIEDRIKSIEKLFYDNFGKYGLYIDPNADPKRELDSLTLYYSSQWTLLFTLNNLKYNKELCLMISGLSSFQKRYIDFYKQILNNKECKLRILFDKIEATSEEGIETMKELTDQYKERIQIRYSAIPYATSRRILGDEMGIDGRKLLDRRDLRQKEKTTGDSFYVGTIYLQKAYVDKLKEHFDSSWDHSKDGFPVKH